MPELRQNAITECSSAEYKDKYNYCQKIVDEYSIQRMEADEFQNI